MNDKQVDDGLTILKGFYFLPSYSRIYTYKEVSEMHGYGLIAAGSECAITGAVDMLLSFIPKAFGREDAFFYNPKGVVRLAKPCMCIRTYRRVASFISLD